MWKLHVLFIFGLKFYHYGVSTETIIIHGVRNSLNMLKEKSYFVETNESIAVGHIVSVPGLFT
jgi:hypothetical protein